MNSPTIHIEREWYSQANERWRPMAISNPSTRLRAARSMPQWVKKRFYFIFKTSQDAKVVVEVTTSNRRSSTSRSVSQRDNSDGSEQRRQPESIKLADHHLESMENFVYLGSVSSDSITMKEIINRVEKSSTSKTPKFQRKQI
uniref:Uncharacterized protein n=1 Tax=Timema tahoe TaxID=61484 RepID=A0A7R9FF87_9NEOP|nr:unnamed protein product [Timema tahoe]